jgi:hypothetical protein
VEAVDADEQHVAGVPAVAVSREGAGSTHEACGDDDTGDQQRGRCIPLAESEIHGAASSACRHCLGERTVVDVTSGGAATVDTGG